MCTSLHLPQHMLRSIDEAVQLLRTGQCLIYPTETFYAVGCAMDSPTAVEHIFWGKQRAAQKPLPVLAAHWQQVQAIAQVGEQEQSLAKDFWPGPLTLICPAKSHILPILTAGTGKVAVRISSNTIARQLAHAVGTALVCSSANISGQTPPRHIHELSSELLRHIPHVLDIADMTDMEDMEDMAEPQMASTTTPIHPALGGLASTLQPTEALCAKDAHGPLSSNMDAETYGPLPSTIVEIIGPKKLMLRRLGAISVKALQAKGWHVQYE